MSESILSLTDFGIAFRERIILSSVTLEVPDTGIVVLVGPCGTGKSTLLKTLAGYCQSNPNHRTWGKAVYAGDDLSDCARLPSMVIQNTRLMVASVLENIVSSLAERETLTIQQQRDLAVRLLRQAGLGQLEDKLDSPVIELHLAEQRHLAILAQAASNPKLLLIDEPTSDLSIEEALPMIEFIRREGEKRAIVIITHNVKIPVMLGGYTALIAGGWVQEFQATNDFFSHPISDAARSYVETGSCSVPSPNARPEDVAPELASAIRKPPKDATRYKSHVLGPNGFLWLYKGRLAGTPRPGLLVDIEQDLKALKRVGVTDLISLTEKPLDKVKCKEFGIDVFASPIPDMHAPSLEQAFDVCQKVGGLLQQERVVAIHCRAGLGRTGTLLACQLIYEGKKAVVALDEARRIEPRWIQSEEQAIFLQEFEQFMKSREEITVADGTPDAGINGELLNASIN